MVAKDPVMPTPEVAAQRIADSGSPVSPWPRPAPSSCWPSGLLCPARIS